jgi:hypothetical protein
MAPPIDEGSVEALIKLCHFAAQSRSVDTPTLRVPGVNQDDVDATVAILKANPIIGEHLQHGKFLYHAAADGGNASMMPVEHWLGAFVRLALASAESEWRQLGERFLSLLTLECETAPFIVSTTLLGVLLADAKRINMGNGTIRQQPGETLMQRQWQVRPLPAVEFEYEVELPVTIASDFLPFPDPVAQRARRAHEEVITKLLLAFAFATSGPVQVDLTMYKCTFALNSGGSHAQTGPIVVPRPTVLDDTATEQLTQAYVALADVPVAPVGIATRRYLLARSERARPDDRVLDYAIAIESMTEERGGQKQGQELARILGDNDTARARIEDEHKRFRRARESIVHYGSMPTDVRQAAEIGERLVRMSLGARTHLRVADAGTS